ncbi:DUF590-domain-containing protein [Nadsonia fulvescens var. elongata DSM 6958]|uniref:DUF590-domain-containing protein n=1 Tax=Nadsonia fulvescens var. elongata DSM 6958 TaxID=857566 RepID=A0A1E3PG73_9ASCO|nr:DUF590-domain-containing protein [Nadsonia fulvescens var. elongata DSM 6958]
MEKLAEVTTPDISMKYAKETLGNFDEAENATTSGAQLTSPGAPVHSPLAATSRVATEKSKSGIDTKNLPLQDMGIDYSMVLNTEEPSKVEKLIKALTDNGLFATIRAGPKPGQLLVFVRASNKRLTEELVSSSYQDWLYGISSLDPADPSFQARGIDDLSSAERLRLVYNIISATPADSGAGITPGYGVWKFIDSIFPLHNHDLNKKWVKDWSSKFFISDSDIDQLRSQHGEKVAFYFAFLKFYFLWLILPTVAGILAHFMLGAYSIFFTVINTIWCIAFVQVWKRRELSIALKWGVKGSTGVEIKRYSFIGESVKIDPVTGVKRAYYPQWKRTLKQLASVPAITSTGVILILAQCIFFFFEIFLTQFYDGPLKSILSLAPTAAIVLFGPIITIIQSKLADRFTEWENHENEDTYEESKVRKMFMIQFLLAYMALFITSYFYIPFGSAMLPQFLRVQSNVERISGFKVAHSKDFSVNVMRLNKQVTFYLITSQIIGFVVENVMPVVKRALMTKIRTIVSPTKECIYPDLPNETEFLAIVREEASRPTYNVHDDYREMVIQFGYVTMFSSVWSLSPLCTFINNWVELRGDAIKISKDTKRPIPQRAESIGPWYQYLVFLTWLTSLISPTLVAIYGKSTEDNGSIRIGPWFILSIVLFSEHGLFLASKVISLILDNVETQESVIDKRRSYIIKKRYYNDVEQSSVGTLDIRSFKAEDEIVESQWKDSDVKSLVNSISSLKVKTIDTKKTE